MRFVRETAVALIIVACILAGAVIARSLSFFRNAPQPPQTITVTIPEGSNVKNINILLSDKGVLAAGEELSAEYEGYLFPDTYEFYANASSSIAYAKFKDAFDKKVLPLMPTNVTEKYLRETLTMASMIEKEVSDPNDRKIVSGIMHKRLDVGMPLQVDATICYIKGTQPCIPITDKDKKISSPYNTYAFAGLPPGPIGNPGIDAIVAAMNPEKSPYWYYLSDPESGDTIFAKTLDEHIKNIVKYLGS